MVLPREFGGGMATVVWWRFRLWIIPYYNSYPREFGRVLPREFGRGSHVSLVAQSDIKTDI